jgi:carbon storage regulator CsrA
MLVLTRRPGEKIVLRLEDGREIEIVLVETDRGRVRLGVAAPRTVTVSRGELKQRSGAPLEGEKP